MVTDGMSRRSRDSTPSRVLAGGLAVLRAVFVLPNSRERNAFIGDSDWCVRGYPAEPCCPARTPLTLSIALPRDV
jgi:hypothetical protein